MKSGYSIWVFIIGFLFGLVAVWLLAVIPSQYDLPDQGKYFVYVTLSGAIGGLLYTTQNQIIKIPHREQTFAFNLGFISDILAGIVGAYIVFLILPFDVNLSDPAQSNAFNLVRTEIEIIATSLIGGYAGRALMNRIQRDMLNLERKVEGQQKEIKQLQQQDHRDAETLSLISKQLDLHHKLSAEQIRQIKTRMKTVTHATRVQIFYRAKAYREQATLNVIRILDNELNQDKSWEEIYQSNQVELNESGNQIEWTIPIFEALIEADTEQKYHRNFAQLAYAIKDRIYAFNLDGKEWLKAKENLDAAIQKRTQYNIKETSDYALYEFNRAICNIEIDGHYRQKQPSPPEMQKVIVEDLKTAQMNPQLGERIHSPRRVYPIYQWLACNENALSSAEKDLLHVATVSTNGKSPIVR